MMTTTSPRAGVNGEYVPPPTPRNNPRITAEGVSNAERCRGNMDKWFDYGLNENYESPRPVERLPTAAAKNNAERNKGCMLDCMGGYADPPVQRNVHPRAVRSEAAEAATNDKGGAMKNLIDNYGNLGLSNRPQQRVKGGEAEDNAERNAGTVNKLLNNYGTLPISDRPPQKVSYGGEEVAAKHTGADMGPIMSMVPEENHGRESPKAGKLHQASEGPGWDESPPKQRTRPEARVIADKGEADIMGNMIRGEVAPPTVRETKVLKHMEETRTPRPKTSPARTKPEAMQSYQKNTTSDMGAIMRGETSPQNISPSRKILNRNLKRSEDW